MGESLMVRRRVWDEALRGVNHCQGLGNKRPYPKEAPANSVPAAAVIQRVQALIGITGLKAFVGGLEGAL